MEVPIQFAQLSNFQKTCKDSISHARVAFELIFKEVKKYSSTVEFKIKMRLASLHLLLYIYL